MNRQETLEKALDAVNRRPKAYGPPEQNFDRIARRWNAHLRNAYGDPNIELDAVDVALMCADIKMARIEETRDHEDSWVDLAGYAACGAEVATGAGVVVEVATGAGVVAEAVDDGWVTIDDAHPLPTDLVVGDRVRIGGSDPDYAPGEYSIYQTVSGYSDLRYALLGGCDAVWNRAITAYKRVASAGK